MTTYRLTLPLFASLSMLSLALIPAAGCSDDVDPMGDDGMDETAGDGDGDPTTSGDGDGDDPTTTGDGDGDDPTTTGDGDGDGDDPTTTGDGDGDDLTPPTVTMTTPSADEAGVLPDVVIEISFSEPMDKASVQAAWQSSDLPAADVTFAWNDEGTVLTATPNDPLVIAEVASLDDPAEAYSFSINTAATDLAGNSLEADLEVAFTTARRWTYEILPATDMTKYVASNGSIGPFETDNRVGDNAGDVMYRTFVSYDLAEIPDDLVELELASFQLLGWTGVGNPFAISGGIGPLMLDAISFATIESTTYNLAVDEELVGLVFFANIQTAEHDVTAQVLADVGADADYTQYRLAMAKDSNENGVADYVTIAEADIPLELTVLIP